MNRQQCIHLIVLSVFCAVAIGLGVPGLLAKSEGWLKYDSDSPPFKIRVGWEEGCISEAGCDGNDEKDSGDLEKLFSKTANRTGLVIMIVLSIVLFSAICIFLFGVMGICCNTWFGNAAMFLGMLGAFLAVSLVFLVTKFADEVETNVKDRTRGRLDVVCDAELICRDVFEVGECGRQNQTCQIVSRQVQCDGFNDCEVTRFLKACDLPGVVCELDRGHAHIISLAEGLWWLLFGFVTLAIFLPKTRRLSCWGSK